LDKAISPERKSSPKRMIIIAAAFVLSLFFSIGFALFKESYSEIKKDETRYNKIRNGIILPLKNIFRSNKKSS
jgi:capsular polysaccharide biosynthesis protein